MIEDRFVSPKELARAIGASESTLKRWVDSGRIQVARTAGGHRRITLREALRFIRESGQEVLNPEALGIDYLPSDAMTGSTEAGGDDALVAALVRGDAEVSRRILLQRFLGGESVAALCDGPVSQALHQVGTQWQQRDDGVFVEHRTTLVAIQAMMQLRALIQLASPDAPVAVGGGIAGDPYMVPTLMVSTVLAAQGWRETNLGANTPVSAFREAIRAYHPRLIWMSFSSHDAGDKFLREWGGILDLAEERGIAVLVGGQAFPAKAAAAHGHRFHRLANMEALAGFVRALVLQQRSASARPDS